MFWKNQIVGLTRAAFGGIVARLRLTFLCIATTIAVAGILALMQTHQIGQAHNRLNIHSLPQLAQARILEQKLTAMIQQSGDSAAIQTPLHIKQASAALARYGAAVQQHIDQFATFGAPQSMVRDVNNTLSALQSTSDTILSLKLETFEQGHENSVQLTDDAVQPQLSRAKENRTALAAHAQDAARQIVTFSLADVDETSKSLNVAVQRLNYVLAAAFLFALFTIGVALFWVVERQINHRMRKLNAEVTATATGDGDQRITVTGRDELGDMARALEIFQQNAVELRRSNIELEKFAYAAAHDLRSPLRAIRDLAVWAQDDPDTQFSPEGFAYMSLLLARTDRLNQLLSDLLDYARAGQAQAAPQSVDLESLVRQLWLEVDPEQHFSVTCTVPETPICTFATPLSTVLSNLLSNAMKHHDRPRGQIDVQISVTGKMLRIELRDDGPGIDPAYHTRIFELFQVLRPQDEVEGSGLGLAIIAKLTQRYGGSVTLVSNPAVERGCCFIVEMPLFDAQAPAPDVHLRAA